MADATEVDVDGRLLRLSNLSKPLYPGGFTKAEVIRYYLGISDAILPHLADRPLTTVRYPDGVEHKGFFAKRCPPPCPGWLRTVPVQAEDEVLDMVIVEDRPALAWLANLACLELHVPLGRWPDLDRPTAVVFDLDPGAPADIATCARIALGLRELLAELDLVAVPKTTGGKGIHLLVPLAGEDDIADARAFAQAIAELMAKRLPDEVVTTQTKAKRVGKVLVDWTQNHRAKTNACAYTLRARPEPSVSTPLTWAEVEACADGGDATLLRFGPDDVLARIAEHGDLFAAALDGTQRVPGVTR